MPSTYVTATPTFTGFTYDEMMKPLESMQTAYETAEEGMAELESNAQKWAQYAQLNPVLGAKYNAYMNDLGAAADDLMSTGNLRNAGSNYRTLYKRYQSDVQPIQTCATAKSAAVKAAREANEKSGGTTIFEFDPSLVSLDDIYNNPDLLDSNKSVNGKDIIERTKAIMDNFAKADCANMSGEEWTGFIYGMFGPQYFESVINKGLSQQQVAQAIADGDSSLFGYIADLVLEPTGILNWRSVNGDKNSYNYQNALKYVEQGFWNGMGEAQRLQVENKDYSLLGRGHGGGSGGGSGSQDPNDRRAVYKVVSPNSPETKADQQAREKAKADMDAINAFYESHPDFTYGEVSHDQTDEEYDLLKRQYMANHYHTIGYTAEGEAYYPEISYYDQDKQNYAAEHGPQKGGLTYNPEYEEINNIVRKYSYNGQDWDGTKDMLDRVLAEATAKGTTRSWQNNYSILSTDLDSVARYIKTDINDIVTAATAGKYKVKDSDIWEKAYGKNMKERDKRVGSQAALELANADNISDITYNPAQSCFEITVTTKNKSHTICVSTNLLFQHDVATYDGYTLYEISNRLSELAQLPTMNEQQKEFYNYYLDVYLWNIVNNAFGLTQGQPKTNAKVGASFN